MSRPQAAVFRRFALLFFLRFNEEGALHGFILLDLNNETFKNADCSQISRLDPTVDLANHKASKRS